MLHQIINSETAFKSETIRNSEEFHANYTFTEAFLVNRGPLDGMSRPETVLVLAWTGREWDKDEINEGQNGAKWITRLLMRVSEFS